MSSADEQPQMVGDGARRRPPAETEADPDQVALDELLRAFAIDAYRVAEEDRTDSEIDRHVDEVLGEAPGGREPATSRLERRIRRRRGRSRRERARRWRMGMRRRLPSETTPRRPELTVAPPVHVITIADDEFPPDAVYVEGDLGGPDTSGERPVVFIDDDVVVTETPEDSRRLRRRIEPRLRDRRIAVRRAESRRRLRWVVLAVFVLVVAGAGLAVLGSSLFAIEADHVRVEGNVYTDRVRLQAVIDDLVGTPVLAADTQAAERELEAIPWVDQARVRTDFPHGVTIEIRERVALADLRRSRRAVPRHRRRRSGARRDRRSTDRLHADHRSGSGRTAEPGEYAPVGYGAAAKLVQGLTGSVRGRVQSIDVTADGSQLRLLLDDATEVRFGAASDLVTKLVRLETALGAAGDQVVRVIDVSTAEVVVQ